MQDETYTRAKELYEKIEEYERFLTIYENYDIDQISLIETIINNNTKLVLTNDIIPDIIQIIRGKLENLQIEFDEL